MKHPIRCTADPQTPRTADRPPARTAGLLTGCSEDLLALTSIFTAELDS